MTRWIIAALVALSVLTWPAGHVPRLAQALIPPDCPSAPASGRLVRRLALCGWMARRGWRRRQRNGLGVAQLVALVDALAPALDAGLGPARAWELAVRSSRLDQDAATGALVRGVAQASAAGAPAGPEIVRVAQEARSTQLLVLGTAWRLSEQTGAPLAAMARTVARMLRADQAAVRRLEAVVTESRTTARILTALPLSGPLFAAVLGIDIRAVATSGPWLWMSVASGVLLAVLGRMWLARLAAAVVRGPTLS